MSGPSIDVSGVGALKLADITPVQPAELAMQQDLSRAFDSAIQKAISFPVNETGSAHRPNPMLEKSKSNDFVREQPMTEDKDPEMTRQLDQVTDRFRDVYVEMTNFSVAWNVAKRSGRDVETLLKGQ